MAAAWTRLRSLWNLFQQLIGRRLAGLTPSRRVRLALLGLAGLTVLAAVSLASLLVYYTMVFPHPLALTKKERAPVVRILARDGAVLAERGAAHDYMPLDMLPDHVIRAVVATEDRRFFQHWGLDLSGLARAAFANLRAGRYTQGGSSLTQQLAKNLFLSPERTLSRKVEELVLALWLEMRLSKYDILELYLNRVYFGGGAYGIEAAAQRYFEKSARELSAAEAAIVAGLLKAPSKFSPTTSPGYARGRGRVVLASMLAAGAITPEQHRHATSERIRFAEQRAPRDQGGAEYLVELVLEHLPPLLGAGHAEVVVETTLDVAFQRKAHAIVQQHLERTGDALGASQAAVVVLDADGGIRAMVGGRSFAESQFNRAVKARRQPGSAFKPFVFLAALESGMTADSVAYDLPLTVDGWSPRNDTAGFRGAMSLRQAMAQSVNTVAVRLLLDVGAPRVVRTAKRVGIRSELSQVPALALGASEIGLLELTGAYAVFANGGSTVEPHAIRRVRMSSGRIIYAREAPRHHQAVAPAHIAAINDMLHGAIAAGTGRRAVLAKHPAAGKTGTTQDFRDAWFMGYTAHLVGGVWVGNDNGRPMGRVMGGGLPAEIWRDVMQAGHEGRTPLALPGVAGQPSPRPAAPSVLAPIAELPATEALLSGPAQKSLTAPIPRTRAPADRPARVKPPLLPRESIDADFIARAIGESERPTEPSTTPAASASDRERTTRMPSGFMSLGVRQ